MVSARGRSQRGGRRARVTLTKDKSCDKRVTGEGDKLLLPPPPPPPPRHYVRRSRLINIIFGPTRTLWKGPIRCRGRICEYVSSTLGGKRVHSRTEASVKGSTVNDTQNACTPAGRLTIKSFAKLRNTRRKFDKPFFSINKNMRPRSTVNYCGR